MNEDDRSDQQARLLMRVRSLRAKREAAIRRQLVNAYMADAPRPTREQKEADAIEAAVIDAIWAADRRN